MAKPKNINEYIKNFPAGTQKTLKQIRATIKKITPAAEEVISYGIPAFRLNERALIYFAGWKEHVSIYPVPKDKAFQKEVENYQTGKGTLQFPLDKPLPLKVITKAVKLRVKENTGLAKAKKKEVLSTETRRTLRITENFPCPPCLCG